MKFLYLLFLFPGLLFGMSSPAQAACEGARVSDPNFLQVIINNGNNHHSPMPSGITYGLPSPVARRSIGSYERETPSPRSAGSTPIVVNGFTSTDSEMQQKIDVLERRVASLENANLCLQFEQGELRKAIMKLTAASVYRVPEKTNTMQVPQPQRPWKSCDIPPLVRQSADFSAAMATLAISSGTSAFQGVEKKRQPNSSQ